MINLSYVALSQGLADICIDDSKQRSGGGSSVDERAGIAAEIAKWASRIADVLGYVPAFLCGICAGAAFIFGLLAFLGYALAKNWNKAVGALVSAGVGLVAGKAGKHLIKRVVDSYGGKMMHFAKHHSVKENGALRRVTRMVPSSLRVKVEWLVTSITGTISAAFSAIATMDP
jgi:hypothetical protein